MPTTADAERLAHDLGAYLGPDQVDLFPAWETLPFERVSPGVETMGRRLRTIWRLLDPERTPDVVVAPIRALVQRLGPDIDKVEPIEVRPGERRDRDELVAALVHAGYRREDQVEHRGEVGGARVDRRRVPVDRRPSRPHRPVGRRGRPAHRVLGQRPALDDDLNEARIFPCRELLPTDEVRARAGRLVVAAAVGPRAVGAAVRRPHVRRHGVVAAVARRARSTCCSTSCPPTRRSCSSSRSGCATVPPTSWPRRPTSPARWPRRGAPTRPTGFPSLHLPFDRLLVHTNAPAWTVTVAPEGPDVTTIQAMGWDPVVGGGERLMSQLADLRRQGYRIVVSADGEGSKSRASTACSTSTA